MSGAVVAVARWLVRATDDRVVTACACVFRRHNNPSVSSIWCIMGDVNIVYINIDFLNDTFYEVLLSRILSGLANSSTE